MQTSIGGYDMYIYQSIQAVAWLALQTSDLKILDLKPEDLSNDAYVMILCCCFFLIVFIRAYVVGTHLNCIDKSMQFK